jgi:hypothetical protein
MPRSSLAGPYHVVATAAHRSTAQVYARNTPPIAIGTNARTKAPPHCAGHNDRDQGRHQPGLECEPSGLLAEQTELEFVARQQEEEPEAHIRYQLKVLGFGSSQDLRPDHDPSEDEDHHPGTRSRERRPATRGVKRGEQADDGEVEQPCSSLTVDHLPRTTPMAALAEEGASS